MSKFWYLLVVLFLAPILFAEGKKVEKVEKVEESKEVVMTGDYKWLRGEKVRFEEKLKGVFTPKGNGEWDVSFHFKFKKRDYNYVGTAKGNLDNGQLEGEVRNDGGKGKRSFTFSGDMKDGSISGTHNETTKGRAQKTGVFTLKKA